MAIILNDNLKINAGKPVDIKYLASTNQPYESTSAVLSAIPQALRYVGLTVNVNNIEYWFYNGVADGNLVIKDSGVASTGLTTAVNGLTKVGSSVKLGGTLTGSTIITDSRGTPVGIQYGGDYSANYTARSLVDAGYVTGKTSQTVINATNGLTKVGTRVSLGGALTGNTSLTGNYTLTLCGNAKLNTTCGYQISGTTMFKTSINDINSIAIGNGAGTASYTGNNNIAIGCQVLSSLTTGCNNVGIGVKTLNKNCTGLANVAIGNLALSANTTGGANVAIGTCTLYNNISGNNNIAIGTCSLLCNTTGLGNIALGTCGLRFNTSGCQNVSVGALNLISNTTGCYNIALSTGSLAANTVGCNNIALGYRALHSNVSGQTNIAIGQYAGRANVNGNKSIFIGECAGYNETASGKLYIATGATSTLIYGDFVTNSVTLPILKLCTTPAAGATSDSILVWNTADKCVKAISGGQVLTSAITGATNGLTKSGQVVKLGGNLCEATTISGNSLCVASCFNANCVQNFVFDETPTPNAYQEGRLYYTNNQLNFDREISGVTLQIGEEEVVRVTNVTGGLISNGTVVYIHSAVSGLPAICKSVGSNICAQKTIGVTTQDILDNNEGYVTILGQVHDVNTSAYSAGDILWLSPTNLGGMTNVRPPYPYVQFAIGAVTKVGVSDGSIVVRPLYVPPYAEYGQFTGYTACTNGKVINKLECSVFNQYTGNTATCICYLDCIADRALTGATNGLTLSASRLVCLGGTLNGNTSISGAHCLQLGDLENICLSTCNTTDIALNAKSNGAIYLKSQSGTVASSNDTTNAVLVSIDYNASPAMLITDNTASPHGLVYAADYSSTFCSHSLVDKYYVDSVATGLNVHAAVVVATTTGVTLSGLSQTIDGITPTLGMRILVKDQTNQKTNGIYSASTGTWGRTDDYNFAPSGEVANGDLILVLSGTTNANSQWILTTPNPIISGTSNLIFSKFSQQQGVVAGNGICATTVGANKQIDVKLGASNCGLCFNSTALELDYNIFRYGLTCSQTAGKVDVKTAYCTASGTEIPVALNTGNTSCKLYVDSCTIKTTLGTPIVTANNGLTKVGCVVSLGGTLTGDTTINGNSGAYDLCLIGLDAFALTYDNGATITDSTATPRGLVYAANYGSTFTDRSLVDKAYVNSVVTGSTLTYNNGLTKIGKVISWGGALTGNTGICYGTNRLCFTDGGTSCIDVLSDCSKVHVENTSMCLQSCCTVSGCLGTVCLDNSGAIKITTNNATLPICITAPQAMKYAGDYSSTFTARSIPDVAYVTGKTSSGITFAGNGLTKEGNTVILGGSLTGVTQIDLNYQYFVIQDSATNPRFQVNQFDDTVLLSTTGGSYICVRGDVADNILLDTFGGAQVSVDGGAKTTTISGDLSYIEVIKDIQLIRDNSVSQVCLYSGGTTVCGDTIMLRSCCPSTFIQVDGTIDDIMINSSCTISVSTTNASMNLSNDITNDAFCATLGTPNAALVMSGNSTTGNLCIVGTTVQLTQTPSSGATSDSVLVRAIDGTVKQISVASITGATNSIASDTQIIFKSGSTLVGNANLVYHYNVDSLQVGTGSIASGQTSVAMAGGMTCSGATSGVAMAAGITTGQCSVAMSNGKAHGTCGTAMSSGVVCYGTVDSVALASGTVFSGASCGVAMATGNVCPNAIYGIAMGYQTYAVGLSSIAMNGGTACGNCSIAMAGSTTCSGATYGIAMAGGYALGICSVAMANSTAYGLRSVSISGGQACADNSVAMTNGTSEGIWSLAIDGSYACADNSLSIGQNNTIFSSDSAVIGGFGNILSSGNTCTVLLGGNNITVPADTLPNTVIVPNLAIWSTPSAGATNDSVLVWNSADKKVKAVAGSSVGDKNNIYAFTAVTTSVTLGTGSSYVILANPSAPLTITLPATPLSGQVFKIKDISGNALTNNITVSGNGNNIDGSPSGLINTDYGALELLFNGTAWFSLAFIN